VYLQPYANLQAYVHNYANLQAYVHNMPQSAPSESCPGGFDAV
jgi:hypothetical protein